MNIETGWAELKSFVDTRGLSIQYVDINNRYWLFAFDGPFSVSCSILKKAEPDEDQTAFEASYKAAGNKSISTTIGSIPDPAPFARPLYRTKHNATEEIVEINPDEDSQIDFLLPAERYVNGGTLIIKNAEFGDWISASVEDTDGVIPSGYRAALCEAWPVVATYIEREWVKVCDGAIAIHEVDTSPLNAKITAGLYLRVHYRACADGAARKVGVNYKLTKKL